MKILKLEFVSSSHGKSTCIDLRVGDSSTRTFVHIRHEVAYLASIRSILEERKLGQFYQGSEGDVVKSTQ